MLSKTMEAAINEQINAELYSAYLYMSMMAQFEAQGLKGIANWMRVQAMEETTHAYKFYDYVIERGGEVKLKAIEGPPTEWANALAAFEHVAQHEAHVTSLINNLMDIAIETKDHASTSFLQWFIDEQVEEEANVSTIVDQLRLVGDNGVAIYMIDQQLGQRAPATAAAPAE
jgi:ferritin